MLNSHISQEFTDKIHEANQLYKEALLSFLPESAKGHLLTIQSELSALAKDCLMCSAYPKEQGSAKAGSHGTNKVKKVIIN